MEVPESQRLQRNLTHIWITRHRKSRIGRRHVSTAAEICFHTSDVGLKGIYSKRKDEKKGEKHSLHQT